MFLSLLLFQIIQVNSQTEGGYRNEPVFIDRILEAHNNDRKLVNSPPVGWDQKLADCAYVAACFQTTGHGNQTNPHSYSIGMRPCNSYTCGGVTCEYTSNTENVAGFSSSKEDGYVSGGGVALWIAEPMQQGHRGAVQNAKNTRIGCGTYQGSGGPLLYCRYSTGCVCKDETCCNSCYPVLRNGQCKDTIKQGIEYYSSGWPVCNGFPDATGTIVKGYVPEAVSFSLTARPRPTK